MGKYHAYVLASTKRLGRFRERLTSEIWAMLRADRGDDAKITASLADIANLVSVLEHP